MNARRGTTTVAVLAAAVLAASVIGPAGAAPSGPPAPAESAAAAEAAVPAAARTASVYVVHALPDTPVSVTLDDREQRTGVQPSSIIGPFRLTPGEHQVTVTGTDPDWTMDAAVTVSAGGSADVVLHRPAAVGTRPTVTVYDNPLQPVPAGTGRVVVAHTATVPPADVRVDGRVVFANIANGEFATAEVPSGRHQVSIVPTGRAGPALLGPLELAARSGTLTRVFAVGRPQDGSMDVIVQELPLPTRGSAAPEVVDTGSAGLVAGLPVGAVASR